MYFLDLRHYTCNAVHSHIWSNGSGYVLCADHSDAQRALFRFIRTDSEAGEAVQTVLFSAGVQLLDVLPLPDHMILLTSNGTELFLYKLSAAPTARPHLQASFCFCAPIRSAVIMNDAVLVTLQASNGDPLGEQVQRILLQDHISMLWHPQTNRCVCLRDYTLGYARADECRLLPNGRLLVEHHGNADWLAVAEPSTLTQAALERHIDLPIDILERVQHKDVVQFTASDDVHVWYDTTYTLNGQRKLVSVDLFTGKRNVVDTMALSAGEYRYISGLGLCRMLNNVHENIVQPIDGCMQELRFPHLLHTVHGYTNGVLIASDGRCTVLFDVQTHEVKCCIAQAAVQKDMILLY